MIQLSSANTSLLALKSPPPAPVAIIVIQAIAHFYAVADSLPFPVNDDEPLAEELAEQGSLLCGSHPTGPNTED